MKRFAVWVFTLLPHFCPAQTPNYREYHTKISRAEEFIVTRQFDESLKIYRALEDRFEHLFLRDIKVAAQLAAHLQDTDNLFFFPGARNAERLDTESNHEVEYPSEI